MMQRFTAGCKILNNPFGTFLSLSLSHTHFLSLSE
jgi:hypothetical protein